MFSVPVEIVEEGEEVESQFAPAFFLTVRQDVSVHDGCWVVESWAAHHWSAHVPADQHQGGLTLRNTHTHKQINDNVNNHSPPNMIGQQWEVEDQGEPLGCTEEHHAEEEMNEILWKNQLSGEENSKRTSWNQQYVCVFYL